MRRPRDHQHPRGRQEIGNGAFGNCDALKTITLPASVQSIGEFAFADCSALEAITLSASVRTIGKYAFARCQALRSVTLPRSLEGQMEDAHLTGWGLKVTFT